MAPRTKMASTRADELEAQLNAVLKGRTFEGWVVDRLLTLEEKLDEFKKETASHEEEVRALLINQKWMKWIGRIVTLALVGWLSWLTVLIVNGG